MVGGLPMKFHEGMNAAVIDRRYSFLEIWEEELAQICGIRGPEVLSGRGFGFLIRGTCP